MHVSSVHMAEDEESVRKESRIAPPPKLRIARHTDRSVQDCGQCEACLDKVKFGGKGKKHLACILKNPSYLMKRKRPASEGASASDERRVRPTSGESSAAAASAASASVESASAAGPSTTVAGLSGGPARWEQSEAATGADEEMRGEEWRLDEEGPQPNPKASSKGGVARPRTSRYQGALGRGPVGGRALGRGVGPARPSQC